MRALAVLCAVAALVMACVPGPAAAPTPDPLAGTYTGYGATTALDNMKLFADAFSKLHPGVVFDLKVIDTDTSVVKVRNDPDTQFGFIGRELRPGEGLVATTPMGSTGSAFAVNAANPVRSLTRAQLRSILTGGTRDWSAVGGPAAPIKVVIREASSQTRSSLESYVFGQDKPVYLSTAVVTAAANTASTEMLDALKAFSGSIGMVTLDSATLANKSIALVGLDGVMPTQANLATGAWPVQRPLYLTTNADPAAVKPAIKALVDFLRSPQALQLLSAR